MTHAICDTCDVVCWPNSYHMLVYYPQQNPKDIILLGFLIYVILATVVRKNVKACVLSHVRYFYNPSVYRQKVAEITPLVFVCVSWKLNESFF